MIEGLTQRELRQEARADITVVALLIVVGLFTLWSIL